jgi:hypothetical protein
MRFARHVGIGRIQFDQDRVALQAISDEAGRASAAERVEHRPADRAAGLDAGLDQVGREGGEVRLAEGLRRDGPDAALVAGADEVLPTLPRLALVRAAAFVASRRLIASLRCCRSAAEPPSSGRSSCRERGRCRLGRRASCDEPLDARERHGSAIAAMSQK